MHALDWTVIGLYFAAVLTAGLVLGGRQRDAADYFLGHRGLPGWAIMLSIVATETSALTVIMGLERFGINLPPISADK